MTADLAQRELNPAYRERLFAVINESPFVQHMGMRISELGSAQARFDMVEAQFRLQPFGVAHGGNFATLIDSATYWACYLGLDDDQDGLTSVDLKLNYLAPSRIEPITCVGKLIKAGRTLSYAEAEVRNQDGRLLAHGTSTLMRLSQFGLKLGIPMWLG